MNSELSIYVPAFNAERTIKLCVNSILAQTLKPIRILVVNDGSTDKTKDIILSFGNKIEIIDNKINYGVSHSMNIATNYLQTKYIGKIDADVEISPNWAELLIKKLQKEKVTLIGGKMYEKFLENPFNYWRSIRLKQNWGENDLLNPKFIFGCNNILDTTNIKKKEKYRNDHVYFKTNGEDIEFSNFLKESGKKLYYYSDAICYHLQDDNGLSISNRYWRYMYYGDGLKKRNFIKTIKNIMRQLKRIIKWSITDILNFNLKLLKVNFIVLYYFIIIDLKFYMKNRNEK